MTLWEKLKNNFSVKIWAFTKVPMIWLINPRIEELNLKRVQISVPLKWVTKNHFNSVYMAVLVAGADIAAGVLALKLIQEKKAKMGPIFKDLKANFLKRAEGRTQFVCEEGEKVTKMVERALKSGQREQETVRVVAYCHEKLGQEPVAEFFLTLSLKNS